MLNFISYHLTFPKSIRPAILQPAFTSVVPGCKVVLPVVSLLQDPADPGNKNKFHLLINKIFYQPCRGYAI